MKCTQYSGITVESGIPVKSLEITLNIFAVHCNIESHMYKVIALCKIERTLVARSRKRDGYKVGGPHHFSQGASTFFSRENLSVPFCAIQQRYTYRVLQTIQMDLILLCV